MEKEQFRERLQDASAELLQLTRVSCFNQLADNYEYIITPNSRDISDHLAPHEISVLKNLNKYEGKLLTAGQVVELLHHDDKVPMWINMTVYEALSHVTIIDLLVSRRLRSDGELYRAHRYPPFNLLVPLPPEPLRKEKNGKYDINWKKIWNDKKKDAFASTRWKWFE